MRGRVRRLLVALGPAFLRLSMSLTGFDLLDEIPADISLPVLVEKQFDISTQFTLITLQVNQIINLFIIDLLANFALVPHRINGCDRAFDIQQFQ